MIDYYPYGREIPGCSYTAEAYRYGYQGSERDRNLQGGTGYTTFFRSLDPRLGRWLNPDPKKFPWQSPYCSMDCNPVGITDVMGDEGDEAAGQVPVRINDDGSIDQFGPIGTPGLAPEDCKTLDWVRSYTPPLASANTPANNVNSFNPSQIFFNFMNQMFNKINSFIDANKTIYNEGTTDQGGGLINIMTSNEYATGNSYTSKDKTLNWDAVVFPFLNGDASVMNQMTSVLDVMSKAAEVADFTITVKDFKDRLVEAIDKLPKSNNANSNELSIPDNTNSNKTGKIDTLAAPNVLIDGSGRVLDTLGYFKHSIINSNKKISISKEEYDSKPVAWPGIGLYKSTKGW